MPAAALLEVDDHLASCVSCRELVIKTRQVLRALAAAGDASGAGRAQETQHLLYDQITCYVDDELGETDREAVENHIESCRLCAEELDDLREFKSRLASTQAGKIAPQAGVTARELPARFWRRSAYRVALQAAAAAAAVVLGVIIAAVPLQTRIGELRKQVSELQRANGALQQEEETARNNATELQGQLDRLQQTQSTDSAAINDGGERVVLTKDGGLSGLGPLPQPYVQAIKSALLTGRVETPPALANVAGKAGTLIGGKGEGISFALHGPVGTLVLTDRPTFRWEPLSGAISYTVMVYDADFNPVGASEPLSSTHWTTTQPLVRGRVYTWQVAASKGSETIKSPTPPAPEAKFRVVEQSKAVELERAARSFKGRHLTLGVIYGQAGLLDDAERELSELVKANPESTIARELLLSVKAKKK